MTVLQLLLYFVIGIVVTGIFVRIGWFLKADNDTTPTEVKAFQILCVGTWPVPLAALILFHTAKWVVLLVLAAIDYVATVRSEK